MNEQTPFVVGARVVVEQSRSDIAEDYIEKVYKNGNFTLRSDPRQQYRPYGDRANETGTGWNRRIVRPWSNEAEERVAAHDRRKAFTEIVSTLYRYPVLQNVTNETIAHLRAALASLKTEKDQSDAAK